MKCTLCKTETEIQKGACEKCAKQTKDLLEKLSPEERLILHNQMRKILEGGNQ